MLYPRLLVSLAWIACMIVIGVGSLLPQTAPPTEYGADKMLHLLGYAVLSGLARLSFPRQRGRWAAVMMIGFGIAIELLQSLVPDRLGSVADAAANTIGAVVGLLVAERLIRLRPRTWRPNEKA